jgi:hypothetical protein
MTIIPVIISLIIARSADTLPGMAISAKERDSIVQVLFVVDEDDQKYREQLSFLQDSKTIDSAEWKAIMIKMRAADSINLIKVKAMLDKFSWLGADQIGEQCNTALFMVIQHADLPVQEKYLPMIREAVKAGKLEPRHLALLEDRVDLREGRRQRYGTQLRWDERVKAYRLAPLEDPDHVDELRKSVGLSSLAVYLAKWGLSWDAEKYKKEANQ